MDFRIDRSALSVPILLETRHELAVIKPAGMASQLTRDPKGTSLLSQLQQALPAGVTAKLPHRLDRVTHGIVVAATSQHAIAFHNQQLRDRRWDKIYAARCLAPSQRSLESLVGMHKLHLRPQGGRTRVVRSGGKPALTEILTASPVPLDSGEIHVLLKLHTGRFHQIRATLAHLDCPLTDDWIYGSSPGRGKERFYLEHIALRFVPYESPDPVVLHWADPSREPIDPSLLSHLDAHLSRWENEGAIRFGGRDAEER